MWEVGLWLQILGVCTAIQVFMGVDPCRSVRGSMMCVMDAGRAGGHVFLDIVGVRGHKYRACGC